MIITIKQQITQAGNGIIWEQLTPDLRERWVNIVKTILSTVQVKDGIERYDVICDDRNNTDLDIQNNRMNCSIRVVPVRAVEFISIDFIITNSGIQFIS
jgi:phage tail sheath protein FI